MPDPSRGLMPRVAAGLAYRAIRNRGTIGGSLALADPAAEWPAILAALDGEATLCGPNGRRALDCTEFVTGIYETRLADDEIVESIEIPKLSADARWGYVKLCAQIGRLRRRARGRRRRSGAGYCRLVLGAANGAPLILTEASRQLGEGGPQRTVARALSPPISTALRIAVSTTSSAVCTRLRPCGRHGRRWHDRDLP